MSFFSQVRARLGLRSRNTKASKSESGHCSWFHFKSRAAQTSSDALDRSATSQSSPPPRQHKYADRIHQTHRCTMVHGCESIDLAELEKAWFARRKSSLHRLSANNMLFEEEVRSPRPAHCFQYDPLALEVTSEGIELELDDFHSRPESVRVEDDLEDFWALVAEIEAVDTGKHVEDEAQSADSSSSDYATYKVAAVLCFDESDHETQTSLPLPQYQPKRRPAPISVSRARPSSLIEHQCNISDTPLTMAGQWPPSASSTSSSIPPRPDTAATADSSLILEWW